MLKREICHLWGPFSIYSYGLAMAIGILVFTWLCLQHPWRAKLISKESFIEAISLSLIVGLIGGRLLFILNSFDRFDSWTELFTLWNGGLSVMGGFIAILCIMPIYLKKNNVPVLPILDLAALYAPLLHAIARLGCLMAGCCFGLPSNLPWAITYTDRMSEAPLNIALHPTQLYMSGTLVVIFLFFYFVLQKRVKAPGQMLMAYLMAESMLRFGIDYLRNDKEYFPWDTSHIITANQWLALGMFIVSLAGCLVIHYTYTKKAA